MDSALIEHHELLVEPASWGGPKRVDAGELRRFEVGAKPRALDLGELDPDGDASPFGLPTSDAAEAGARLIFENLSIRGRPALLMITPPAIGIRVRVNGMPAPRVAVLELGDQVQHEAAVLHVTRMRRVQIGPPPQALVGRRCGVCLTPVEADSEILVHECGSPLHLESGKPDDERLECALLSSCPTCEQPISLQSGPLYVPEL